MKNVFIVGCKGIPAQYGGFETFVENLTKRKINDEIKYHVACISDTKSDFEYNNAHCFNLKVKQKGGARALVADIKALEYIVNYVKENNIKEFDVLILACRIGLVIKKYVKKIHKLNGRVILNPDGHEWKRSKWNWIIRKYWKYSEKKMVKKSDLIVCDSINIKKYIEELYKKENTTFIAYGADFEKNQINDKFEEFKKLNNIEDYNYYLVVGRFVPENNYYEIIKEFLKSKTTKKLIIITNYKNNKLYDELEDKLHFKNDERIKFVGTVYDQDLLKQIRQMAFAYIHGHMVGGTNPSLLEGLALTRLNILYDCPFNKEVALNSALYFSKDNLKDVMEEVEAYNNEKIEELDNLSTNRIKEEYSWEKIVGEYESIFLK